MMLRRYHKEKEQVAESGASEQATSNDTSTNHTIAYNDVTKSDIRDLLSEKGIEYNSRDNKVELYDLLLGSE